jgi:hypothetical protein
MRFNQAATRDEILDRKRHEKRIKSRYACARRAKRWIRRRCQHVLIRAEQEAIER